MRTIVDIPEHQRERLDAYCAAARISRAEAIRRGIQLLVEERERKRREFIAALDDTFGIWKDRGVSTDEYLEQLRAEWER